MTDDVFLVTLGSIIIAEICIIAYLKYYALKQHTNAQHQDAEATVSVRHGKYKGIERRARKRSAGALYQRGDGNWAFR